MRLSSAAPSARAPRLEGSGRGANPTARTVKALGAGAAVALTLSACQWTSTLQTDKMYEPADGSSTSIGDLKLTNVLVVAKSKGAPGTVSGLVTNDTDQAAQVKVGSGQLTVPARQAVKITGAEIPSVQAAPGAMTNLPIETSAGSTQLQVPVLAPEHQYATMTPTPAPTNTPSATNGSGTATPTPSDSQSTESDAAKSTDSTPSPSTTD